MVRLLRAMPELLILVKGMASATLSVLYALSLLIIQMYVFGIIFVHLLRDTDVGNEYFHNVGKSMFSLVVHGTLADSIHVVAGDLAAENVAFFFIFMLYVLLSA